MNPPADQRQDRWRTLMELFEAAAELPPAERQAFLDSADCKSGVRQELVELLQKLDESSGSRAAARVSAPERIGRYVLIEPLGRGGMSEVFLAQDTELDRTVALKFLSVETFGGKPAVEVIIREAKALSALNHPNIVTIYEVVQHGANFAIVMEMVDGTPLRARIGDPHTPGQLASIGQQIAQALAAAHAAGIIHRDIKPENILIRTDGYVKVLDFGLARRINSETQSSTVGVAAGTLRYMSPEQTRGATLTTATDVFSLGLVFYELATGRHPFGAASVFETAHAIATATAAAPSSLNKGLPPEQETLILSMLAKEPGVRPSAAEVASSAWQRPQNGGSPAAAAAAAVATMAARSNSSWCVAPRSERVLAQKIAPRTAPVSGALRQRRGRRSCLLPGRFARCVFLERPRRGNVHNSPHRRRRRYTPCPYKRACK